MRQKKHLLMHIVQQNK